MFALCDVVGVRETGLVGIGVSASGTAGVSIVVEGPLVALLGLVETLLSLLYSAGSVSGSSSVMTISGFPLGIFTKCEELRVMTLPSPL
jgi:hypothetical protein